MLCVRLFCALVLDLYLYLCFPFNCQRRTLAALVDRMLTAAELQQICVQLPEPTSLLHVFYLCPICFFFFYIAYLMYLRKHIYHFSPTPTTHDLLPYLRTLQRPGVKTNLIQWIFFFFLNLLSMCDWS